MTSFIPKISALALPLLIGVGFAGAAIGAGQAIESDSPIRCGIKTTAQGNMIAIEGVLVADSAISGSYQFKVAGSSGGGRSNISQGGQFSASAGEPVTLGRVMLNNGSAFEIDFEVDADGQTFDCTDSADDLR